MWRLPPLESIKYLNGIHFVDHKGIEDDFFEVPDELYYKFKEYTFESCEFHSNKMLKFPPNSSVDKMTFIITSFD
jgi:hypothetical protein